MVTETEQKHLIEQFTEIYAWSGRLEFHDRDTVSVHAEDDQAGSVSLRRDAAELSFKFRKVDGNFNLRENWITSLQGAPDWIGGDLNVIHCPTLVDWGNTLEVVQGELWVMQAGFRSFKGGPRSVGTRMIIRETVIKSLEGFPEKIGSQLELPYTKDLPLLKTLAAEEIWLTPWDNSREAGDMAYTVQRILNKYAGMGKAGAFDCRRELRAAGFEENARW